MRIPPPDQVPERFERVTGPSSAALVRADFLDTFRSRRLKDCAGGVPSGATPVSGGRGAAHVLSTRPFGDIVVRPYLRGGWIRHLVKRRYFLGARAFRELNVTERLRAEGAPVPEVLAAVQRNARPGPGYQACIVTRRIAGTTPAAVALERARSGEVRLLMEQIGRSVRECHEAHGWHADLNAWNLLIPEARPELPVIVIDWDRGRYVEEGVSHRARRSNLERLQRSLTRLALTTALAAWPALERGYARSPGPDPAA